MTVLSSSSYISLAMAEQANIRKFRRKLLKWFAANKRSLPWQTGSRVNPYGIFISEIMLQQTRVDQALPYYQRWIKSVPNFETLACAPMQKLLKIWEGLGYYARVGHLKKAAQIIVQEYGGQIPSDYTKIRALPGVGDYTAAALASFIYDQPYLSIDGNVFRVLSRIFAKRVTFSRQSDRGRLSEAAVHLLDRNDPGTFNRALMRLGVLVCLPKNPKCPVCPVNFFCQAYHTDKVGSYPLPKKKFVRPHYQIAAGIIWKDGKILIAQRKPDGLLGGLWEFPGGKKRRGESIKAACRREIKEETGVSVQVGKLAQKIEHGYSHFSITLSIFQCFYINGKPQPLGCQRLKWVKPKELEKYPFPKANQRIVPDLAAGRLVP